MFDGRGLGRGEGRTCGRPAGLQQCSSVFDVVNVLAGCGVGRVAGRYWCRCSGLRWRSMMCSQLLAVDWVVLLVVEWVDGAGHLRVRACSSVFEGVGGCVGRRLGRSSGRWWTTSACSRVWSHLVVVVWVVSVVWVGSWWTTCVLLRWACRVFEVVGGGGGRRLGRFVACVWSPPVSVRRASVM